MKEGLSTLQELAEGLSAFGDAPALMRSSSEHVSFRELHARCSAISAALCDGRKDARSNRVAVLMSDRLLLPYAVYGAAMGGMSSMILPEEWPADRVADMIARFKPSSVMVDEKKRELFSGDSPFHGSNLYIINDQGVLHKISGTPSRAGSQRPVVSSTGRAAPGDEAAVLFTSGTTEGSKAVPVSHDNLMRTMRMINDFMGVTDPVREYVAIPMTHAFGLRRIFCVHALGGSVATYAGIFHPARIMRSIIEMRCDALSLTPSSYRVLRASFAKELEAYGPLVRYIEMGSAPMSESEKREMSGVFPGAHICMHYGLTEASKATFLSFSRDASKLATVGRPCAGVSLKVVSDEGADALPKQAGEIYVRGFNVAKEYLDNDEMTAQKFREGWFLTGDIGMFDDDGYLIFVGRKDDMINVGGEKVYAFEIESCIREEFPDLDIAVAAASHEILGSVPVLCYPSSHPLCEETFAEIRARLGTRFARHKLPQGMCEVPHIPRTRNGKILRNELRHMVAEAGKR